MRERYDNYWKRNQLHSLANFLLEGNTQKEAAEEFGHCTDWVRKKLRWIENDYPEKYIQIKNKPFMVFKRIDSKSCSLEEAMGVFHLFDENEFWNFMEKVLKKNPKVYIRVRTKIHNSKLTETD